MKLRQKWNIAGLVLVGIVAGAVGVIASEHAGGLENARSVPAPLNPAVTAPVREFSQAFESVAAQVRPAVVSVYSEKTVKMTQNEQILPFGGDLFRQFFGRDQQMPESPGHMQKHEYKMPQRGMGSGMILDKDGHILTNYHVVKDVDKVKVQLADKRQFDAEIVGTDPKSDVAVIRIKGKVPENLPTVKLGKSDALKVGDWVLAIGAPFGLTQTVTAGIISATGRSDVGIVDYEDFLQTDAAINPGNSGGPLVNMSGEIIGMNTAIATGLGQFAGVGFAIPSDMISGFLPSLVKGDTITRGYLGVAIQDLSDKLASQFKAPDSRGALVSQVNKDTPAGKAGLKPGDVIVRYDGKAIGDTRELRKLVAATKPESKVDMGVLRDGKEMKIDVTVGKMPTQEVAAAGKGGNAEPGSVDHFGLNVQPLTPDVAKQFGYEDQHGMIINGVEPGSPAAMANLQEGDLITEVNRMPVSTMEELRSALAKSKDVALLLVKRKDASLFVTLQVG